MYLVIYHLLFVMFVWTYLVAVATPPGFARDVSALLSFSVVRQDKHSRGQLVCGRQYVPETDPPQAEEEYITVAGQAFEDQLQPIRPSKLAPADLYKSTSDGDCRSALRRSSSSLRSASLSTPEEEDEEATAGTEQGEDVVEMRQTSNNGRVIVPLASACANEEDAIAETAPTVGVLGPALGTVLASATDAVPNPPHEEEGLQILPGDQPRCRSTGSTTLAPSDDASAPIPVSRPEAAHVAERLPTSTTPADGHIADVPPRPRRSASPAARSRQSYLDFPDPPPELEPPKPLAVERIPRSLPILTEQYRYDPRERIVRPYRSHRCKHCAKVVLSEFPPAPLLSRHQHQGSATSD